MRSIVLFSILLVLCVSSLSAENARGGDAKHIVYCGNKGICVPKNTCGTKVISSLRCSEREECCKIVSGQK